MKLIEVCASQVGCRWLNEYHVNHDSIVVFQLYLCLDIGHLDDSRGIFLSEYINEDYIDSTHQIEPFLKLLDVDVKIRIWSSKKNADYYLLFYFICDLLMKKKIHISVLYKRF